MEAYCDFCGKSASEGGGFVYIPNSNIHICRSCSMKMFNTNDGNIDKKEGAKITESLFAKMFAKKEKRIRGLAQTPSEIKRELDRFVVGQEQAKKVLSVALYNHGKRIEDESGLIKKSNILLVGPSGSGKTLLAKTCAKLFGVPFAISDVTGMTESGFKGEDVKTCLETLLYEAEGDVEEAETGIIFLDEIDKVACKTGSGKDIGTKSVQSELLKIVEGSTVSVQIGQGRVSKRHVFIDTTDILFICGGAFQGLLGDDAHKYGMGFVLQDDRMGAGDGDTVRVTAHELVTYGLMPELIGRFPVICELDDLAENDLVRMLTEPEDAITKEYELLFEKDGVELVFDPEALSQIAKKALNKGTGARGARSILENLLLDTMFNIPGCKNISKCMVTAESVRTGRPLLI